MDEEIDIRNLFKIFWRRKRFIIMVTVICFIIGIFFYIKNAKNTDNVLISSNTDNNNPGIFYAETDFMLARGKTENTEYDSDEKIIINQSTYKLTIDSGVVTNLNAFATSNTFLKSIVSELDKKYDIKNLENNIIIFGDGSSDIISLIVGFEDKENAIDISNKILNELTNKISKLYKIDEIVTIDGPIILEGNKVKELENKLSNKNSIVEEKTANNVKSNDNFGSKKKIVFITLIGFISSCGFILIVELFNSSVKDEKQLENVTKLKTLIKIPKSNIDVGEYFKILRVNINECKSILITSPEKSDGKSFIAINLAKSFSKLGKKVIFIDLVNNSNPITKGYNGKGLTDYLESNDKLVEKYAVDTNINNLSMLLAGSDLSNQAELLQGRKMVNTLDVLEKIYDVVLIDSSNVLESASTLTVAKIAKYVILVSSQRKTKIENVIRAKNNIEDIGGNVIGNVLNNSIDI